MAPHFPIFLLAVAALAGCAVVPGPVDYGPVYGPAYSTTVYAVPGRWSAQHPGQVWGAQSWQRESEPRRSHGGQWEERRPPPQARSRFEEPERGWRNEPRAHRHELPPQAQIPPQSQPRRVAPPVIQQTESGRAGFMRGLAERAQAARPEPVPRSVEAGQRHPPEPGRRGGRGWPEDGESADRH